MDDRSRAEQLFFEGNRLLSVGDPAAAEACFREALRRVPDFPEALANLAWTLEQRGALAEAEACYLRSLALEPECLEVYLDLGVLLVNQKRFEEAERVYGCALQLAPESAAAWSNLGVLNACRKREAEAEACYRKALALDGTYGKARFNLAYLQLRQGRFEEGWRSLEAREWYAPFAGYFPCPRWNGEDLAGKALVIVPEAGHGDMIQFGRYAAILKAMGAAKIGVVCHPALRRLFATLDGADDVMALDAEVPAEGWDFWAPPLSLPFHCGTRLDSIPAAIPYLHAEPGQVGAWGARLPGGRPRVGLAWKGSTAFENDADRSLPALAMLAPLAAVPGIQFVSLQKGAGEGEAPPPGMALFDAAPWLTDFAETAAAIHCLDLVITVDTAVAHLAGALGKPCWVLLPDYKTDWRWLTERTDSPWYPERMRLFRQPAPGGWQAVVEAVAAALAAQPR